MGRVPKTEVSGMKVGSDAMSMALRRMMFRNLFRNQRQIEVDAFNT